MMLMVLKGCYFMFYEAENAFDTLLGLKDTQNGPHLSNERTAENCVGPFPIACTQI